MLPCQKVVELMLQLMLLHLPKPLFLGTNEKLILEKTEKKTNRTKPEKRNKDKDAKRNKKSQKKKDSPRKNQNLKKKLKRNPKKNQSNEKPKRKPKRNQIKKETNRNKKRKPKSNRKSPRQNGDEPEEDAKPEENTETGKCPKTTCMMDLKTLAVGFGNAARMYFRQATRVKDKHEKRGKKGKKGDAFDELLASLTAGLGGDAGDLKCNGEAAGKEDEMYEILKTMQECKASVESSCGGTKEAEEAKADDVKKVEMCKEKTEEFRTAYISTLNPGLNLKGEQVCEKLPELQKKFDDMEKYCKKDIDVTAIEEGEKEDFKKCGEVFKQCKQTERKVLGILKRCQEGNKGGNGKKCEVPWLSKYDADKHVEAASAVKETIEEGNKAIGDALEKAEKEVEAGTRQTESAGCTELFGLFNELAAARDAVAVNPWRQPWNDPETTLPALDAAYKAVWNRTTLFQDMLGCSLATIRKMMKIHKDNLKWKERFDRKVALLIEFWELPDTYGVEETEDDGTGEPDVIEDDEKPGETNDEVVLPDDDQLDCSTAMKPEDATNDELICGRMISLGYFDPLSSRIQHQRNIGNGDKKAADQWNTKFVVTKLCGEGPRVTPQHLFVLHSINPEDEKEVRRFQVNNATDFLFETNNQSSITFPLFLKEKYNVMAKVICPEKEEGYVVYDATVIQLALADENGDFNIYLEAAEMEEEKKNIYLSSMMLHAAKATNEYYCCEKLTVTEGISDKVKKGEVFTLIEGGIYSNGGNLYIEMAKEGGFKLMEITEWYELEMVAYTSNFIKCVTETTKWMISKDESTKLVIGCDDS